MQSLLAGSSTPYLTFLAVALLSSSGCFPMVLRCSALASKSFPMVFRHGTPGQQMLRHSAASLQTLCHGAPASNKPHPAEKSTPVWLAIWRNLSRIC